MLTAYMLCFVASASLMTAGCGVPALILAAIAALLALRSELRWLHRRVTTIKPIARVDVPLASKG